MKSLQEKYQVGFGVPKEDGGNEWASWRTAIVKKGTPGRIGRPGEDWGSKTMNNAVFYPSLPPGSDITDQEVADVRTMRTVTAGTDDVTDNPSGVDWKTGFVPCPMDPTDDMYTREHNDAFYDDVGGFVERNNTLDRE